MALNRFALWWVMGAFSVAAVLAFPPLHAADGKKKVRVNSVQKAATKTPPRKAVVKTSSRRVVVKIPPRKAVAPPERTQFTVAGLPILKSAAALVVDLSDGRTIYAKNTRTVTPIASITKLMTAMVLLDAKLPLDETIYIDAADLDFLKHTNSRLAVGSGFSRRDMLRLALMSSENRAAASLARSYPGGSEAFVAAMNRKAIELGMRDTRFVESTGLSSDNVSTAHDLVKMVTGAYQYPLIREFTTTLAHAVEIEGRRNLQFSNSNQLIKNTAWEIGLSKTGYISEAGRCLVMQAQIAARPVVIVLLDSWGKYTRTADANRIKKWLESHLGHKSLG